MASLSSTPNAGVAHKSTAPGTIIVQCFLFMSSPFWSWADRPSPSTGRAVPPSAVLDRLNCVLMVCRNIHLEHHVEPGTESPMATGVPTRHGRDVRACHMGNRLKSAVSAGQVGEYGVDVRTAVLHRLGDDLFDRAALLGMANITGGCLKRFGRNHRNRRCYRPNRLGGAVRSAFVGRRSIVRFRRGLGRTVIDTVAV